MTKEAGNCLLKTLEEPPSFITIILTGSNESMFLNTIRSRCMKINFQKIEDTELKKFLENKHGIGLSKNLIKACEGSIEKALRVNEKKEQYEKISKIFGNIENYRLLDVINKLDVIYKNKEDIYEILDYINIILSNSKLKNSKYIRIHRSSRTNEKKLKTGTVIMTWA